MRNPSFPAATLRPLTLAALLGLASLGAAQAQSLDTTPASPVYGGLNLSSSQWQRGVDGVPADERGASGKLFLGYQLTPAWSVEGGYVNFGRLSDASAGTSVHANGVFVDAVGQWAFAPKWALLGRAGLVNANISGSTSGDDRDTGLRAGVGLQYSLSPSVALRGEYEVNHFGNTLGTSNNLNQVSVGLKLGF